MEDFMAPPMGDIVVDIMADTEEVMAGTLVDTMRDILGHTMADIEGIMAHTLVDTMVDIMGGTPVDIGIMADLILALAQGFGGDIILRPGIPHGTILNTIQDTTQEITTHLLQSMTRPLLHRFPRLRQLRFQQNLIKGSAKSGDQPAGFTRSLF
jgi:hypothetical protein